MTHKTWRAIDLAIKLFMWSGAIGSAYWLLSRWLTCYQADGKTAMRVASFLFSVFMAASIVDFLKGGRSIFYGPKDDDEA